MKRGSLSLGMGEEGWVRNNRRGGAFGQFHTFGKKRPPVYLVLLEAPRGPLGKPELVGVHTIHTRPLPGWSLHSEGSSWCRAAPCLCSDPILSLKAGARALCTLPSAQGRPGPSGPSAQIRNRPPELPGLHHSAGPAPHTDLSSGLASRISPLAPPCFRPRGGSDTLSPPAAGSL